MGNLDILRTAFQAAFIDRDLDAVDRFWAEDYRQHSALAAPGREGLKDLLRTMPEDFSLETARAFEDGDYAFTHSIYTGFGPAPMVAFDLFRLEDGMIAEHWDALTPAVGETVSGRSQTDGPAEAEDLDRTDANKALVAEFVDKVLIGRDYGAMGQYISADQYDQHNPQVGDGLEGLSAAAATWAQQGLTLDYRKLHHLVGQGSFVLAVSEGDLKGPVAYWDLWRLKEGKLVEHWDVIAPIPQKLPHDNGVF